MYVLEIAQNTKYIHACTKHEHLVEPDGILNSHKQFPFLFEFGGCILIGCF